MSQRFVYRNKKILAHANGRSCTNCGAQDGSVVAAHSNQGIHGYGKGIKSHDCYVAFLCGNCHSWLDRASIGVDPTGWYMPTREDKVKMFNLAMNKTLLVLFRDGIVS